MLGKASPAISVESIVLSEEQRVGAVRPHCTRCPQAEWEAGVPLQTVPVGTPAASVGPELEAEALGQQVMPSSTPFPIGPTLLS